MYALPMRVFARIMPSVHEIREDELVSVEGGCYNYIQLATATFIVHRERERFES
jgi:hypothetical protein